jgi:hypothetical protein
VRICFSLLRISSAKINFAESLSVLIFVFGLVMNQTYVLINTKTDVPMGYNGCRNFMKRKIFLLSLVAFVLMLAIAGCQREGCTDPKATNYDSDAKKDNGTCVYPEPEPTPVIPTKEITIDWDWGKLWAGELASADSVKKCADMEDVKFVFLNLVDVDEDNGMSTSRDYAAFIFHRAVDSLQKRFDVSDKVLGFGTIFVNEVNGAQLSDPTSRLLGMAAEDSAKCVGWKYNIERYYPHSK